MTKAELRHLIDVIVRELMAATAQPRGLCTCHSVLDDCCPDRLRGVIDAGATRVGVHASGGAPAGVAAMIDSLNCARVDSLACVGYTSPGATQLTRTPSGPSSAARLRLKPTSADFAVV